MFFALATLSQQATHANLTVKFGSVQLSNQGSLFTLPSLNQFTKLNIHSAFSLRSSSPFIRSSNLIRSSVRITNSIFKNFSSNAISLSSINSFIRDETYKDMDYTKSAYDRERKNYDFEVSRCAFINCNHNRQTAEVHNLDCCGGAIFLDTPSTVKIYMTVFQNCAASSMGGAVYIRHAAGLADFKECQFAACSAEVGSAVFLFNDANVKFFQCLFDGNKAVISKDITTGTIVCGGSVLDISSSTFKNSQIHKNPAQMINYAEIYVDQVKVLNEEKKSSIKARDLFFGFTHSNIDKGDHEGIYLPASTSANEALQENLKIDQLDAWLYYFGKENAHRSDQNDIGYEQGVHRTPAITPMNTPMNTKKPKTPIPPVESTGESDESTEINSDPVIIPTIEEESQDSGLTNKQKITIAWAVPVAIIVLIIIIAVIVYASKDHRRADRTLEKRQDEELEKFPDV